jgi:hypothetical protein
VIARVSEFADADGRTWYLGLRRFCTSVVPVLQAQPGFEGYLILVNQEPGPSLGMTLWGTEEDARLAGARLEQQRRTGADLAGAVLPTAQVYDVVDRQWARPRHEEERP